MTSETKIDLSSRKYMILRPMLTQLRPNFPSYRNQSFGLHFKSSVDWFLHDRNFGLQGFHKNKTNMTKVRVYMVSQNFSKSTLLWKIRFAIVKRGKANHFLKSLLP